MMRERERERRTEMGAILDSFVCMGAGSIHGRGEQLSGLGAVPWAFARGNVLYRGFELFFPRSFFFHFSSVFRDERYFAFFFSIEMEFGTLYTSSVRDCVSDLKNIFCRIGWKRGNVTSCRQA